MPIEALVLTCIRTGAGRESVGPRRPTRCCFRVVMEQAVAPQYEGRSLLPGRTQSASTNRGLP